MDFKMLFPGCFYVEIQGENSHRLLRMCSFHNIYLADITAVNTDFNIYKLYVPWKTFQLFRDLCKKTNTSMNIISIHGFLHSCLLLKRHPGLVLGAVLSWILILFLHSRLWDIQVDGNIYYDANTVIRFLEEENIYPGINKNQISCLELSDQIRQKFEKVKWVSTELNGCNLIIHLKENIHDEKSFKNKDTNKDSIKDSNIDSNIVQTDSQGNLIAKRDGIIHKIYVRNGVTELKAGDIIKKGDILVSNQIPIYNDNLEIVRYKKVEADADITVEYDYSYFDEIERMVSEKTLTEQKNYPYIQILHLYLYPSGQRKINTASCLTEIKQLKLTSSFFLPVYYGKISAYQFHISQRKRSKEEVNELLEENFLNFSDNLVKKGVQIYKKNVKMYISDAQGRACGTVTLWETYSNGAE